MRRMGCCVLALTVMAACSDEYRFPDEVPKSSQKWVDPTLRAEIIDGGRDLSSAVAGSYQALVTSACSGRRAAVESYAGASARHSVGIALGVAELVVDPSLTATQSAFRSFQEPQTLFACPDEEATKACSESAAREVAATLTAEISQYVPHDRQARTLKILAEEYRHGVEAVSTGELADATVLIANACGTSPLAQETARLVAESEAEQDRRSLAVVHLLRAGQDDCSAGAMWFEKVTRTYQTALNKRATGQVSCDDEAK